MELCEGRRVHDYIIENDTTSEESRVAKMMKEIVCDIEACHSLGIVHRDLKIENLLFQTQDKDSPLKLINFQLAQFFELGEELTDVVGSSYYIASKVVEGHHSPKADIWSAGVILYALLVGAYPFFGDMLVETYKKIMMGSHDLFDKDSWPTISQCAKDLIGKMLTCNVNEHLSAFEVLKHLWILENAK